MKPTRNKSNRGIALAFALVLLSLLMVIGVSFIILSSNERTSAQAAAGNIMARGLALSALNRANLILIEEINSRPAPETTSTMDNEERWSPISGLYVSENRKEDKKYLRGTAALDEDLERLMIKGVTKLDPAPQWNYIFSPDLPGAVASNNDNREVIGRFAFLGFANAKISLPSTIDSAYKSDDLPDRFGYSVRELRPDAVLTADDPTLLDRLAPAEGTTGYVQSGENRTAVWPDLNTVANQLGYDPVNDAAKIINLYDNFAIGRLPCPEMWRMPAYGRDIAGNKLKAYHRFNIHKTQEDWNSFDVEKMWNFDLDNYAWIKNDGTRNYTPPDGEIGLYYFSGLKPAALGNLTSDQVKKQLLANLKDYNDDDVLSTYGKLDYATGEIDYSGIEAVPYCNDMRLYYAITGKSNGSNNYSVSASLYNIEIEMTNFYYNPELNLDEIGVDIYSDFTATVNGNNIRSNGRQRYHFKRTSNLNDGINFTDLDVQLRGGPTRNNQRKPQPYFCLRDQSDNCIEEGDIQTVDVTGTPILSEVTFRKLIVVLRGKGRFRGKSFDGILSISRPIHGIDIPQRNINYNTAANTNQRCFVNIDIDDPRCNLLAYGWSSTQNSGHEGFAVYRFSAGVNPYHWGAGATINVGTSTYTEENYEKRHVNESELSDAKGGVPILGDRCRDPEYDVIANTANGHTYANYRGHIAYMTTSYIRNAPMISPWELGFIHRVRPWQTLNLKRFNKEYPVTMDFSCNGYVLGDAAILDQIKTTKDHVSYGKINMNTASKEMLRALLKDIEIGGKPWACNNALPVFKDNAMRPPKDDPLFYGRKEDRSDMGMTVEKAIRPNAVSEIISIPESDLDRYAASLYKYIQSNRNTNWYSRAWIANALRFGDIDIVDDLYGKAYSSSAGRSTYDKIPDMMQEELVGKIATMIEGECGREVTVLVVAQSLLDAKNSSGQRGYYEPGADRIIGEAKVLATFEYWPKLTPADEGNENAEYKRSAWVLTRLVYLDPTASGL